MQEKIELDFFKDWLKSCDLLKDAIINIDYLNQDISNNTNQYFSLEQDENLNYKIFENVLGNKKIQIPFTLAGRFLFDVQDENKNSENLLFMQKICNWIEEKNKNNDFPNFEDGECTLVEVTSRPFLAGTNNSMTHARYEIKGKIEIEKRYEYE